MDANEYQKLALRTEKTPTFIDPAAVGGEANAVMLSRITHGLLGVITELGEAADIIKRHLIYGAPLDLTHLMEEAGDKQWYVALILSAANTTMGRAMECNIAKLRTRYPEGFTEAQALTRDLEAERTALELEDPAVADHRRWLASQAADPMVRLAEKVALGLCTCSPPIFVGNMRCDHCGRSLF